MTEKKDPYASEAETQALMVPDTRMKAERKLAQVMAERGADEQGAEAYLILRQIAVELLAEQPAQQQEPVAWMDGYRNIYSLEEKAAGCEDAVIPLVPATLQHWSDCAVHNEPAYPAGKCDCGGYTSPPASKPLTDEMVKRMKENCTSMEMRGAFADGWLSAEAAHGIKENT